MLSLIYLTQQFAQLPADNPTWGDLVQVSATGVLVGVVWMVLTGRLVPRSALLDTQAERDKWYQAAMETMNQNRELLTGARVTHDVLRSLPASGEAES